MRNEKGIEKRKFFGMIKGNRGKENIQRSYRFPNPYIKFLKNFGTPEGVLSAFLFVTVLTQALFAFMSVHFFALSFFSAWHSFNFLDTNLLILVSRRFFSYFTFISLVKVDFLVF